ncbi:MAG: hypothetical protein JWQ74_2544 [Marmoricola sp.]|nr:hypothetical protein [Marmoricola sp.]
MSIDETSDEAVDQVGIYCGRLTCGKLIVHTLGRGRRKEFCSETCRRAADREYKRARGRVELFEEQLRRNQHEVAAYGRKAEEGTLTPEQRIGLETSARIAFTRASTVVELGASTDRAASELADLVAALRPLFESQALSVAQSA